jgi:histidine phosphotransferase ChpT
MRLSRVRVMIGADLSGLIASRICHDLISPVGAISNGLELLEMAPGGSGEEAGLIRQSADAATASLKFMRIAFGAPGFEDMIAQSDVARILTIPLLLQNPKVLV